MLPLSLMVENMHYYLVVINLYISYTGFIFRLIPYPPNPFTHAPPFFYTMVDPPPLLFYFYRGGAEIGMGKLMRANSVSYAHIIYSATFCTEIRSILHEILLLVGALQYDIS